ncbi:hypothetical protein OUZ56_018864 [Daphnia magna]|uniref:Uncharacterized protein n=1 Tax=Daphnia magna TaxID=35525 RepID=A0ABQ9Z9Y6_9CRUS|nr:hypothetical protein OUZ56_018864 [Daphnia magna]
MKCCILKKIYYIFNYDKVINRFDENEQILHAKRLLRADGHNEGISSSAQPASTTLKNYRTSPLI